MRAQVLWQPLRYLSSLDLCRRVRSLEPSGTLRCVERTQDETTQVIQRLRRETLRYVLAGTAR